MFYQFLVFINPYEVKVVKGGQTQVIDDLCQLLFDIKWDTELYYAYLKQNKTVIPTSLLILSQDIFTNIILSQRNSCSYYFLSRLI